MRALLLLFLTGCIPYSLLEESLKKHSSPHMGCPAEQIVISDYVEPSGFSARSSWTASGCDRAWACRGWLENSGTAASRSVDECEETPESQARTILKVATDRLQLETNCPTDQLHLVRQADWKRGTETAYRFEACGKHYVCTAAAGRTDCKPALQE